MLINSIFNLQNIIVFLLGLISGALLLFAIILLVFSSKKKVKNRIYSPVKEAIDEKKINEMIANKQKNLIYQVEEYDKELLPTAVKLSTELIHEVASYYYPDSKLPEYELTLVEATELITYIMDRVSKLLDKPIIKSFKNRTISEILTLINKGKKVSQSAAVKSGDEAIKTYKNVANIINPIYWIKKVVVDGTINIAMKRFGKAALQIVGSEANKIYSKSLFKTDLEDNSDKVIDEIFNDEGDK